jgi:hypothetical protein
METLVIKMLAFVDKIDNCTNFAINLDKIKISNEMSKRKQFN